MIFVDSSFWIAIRVARDERHELAVDLLRIHHDAPLLTSNLVRGETWTFLRRRVGHGSAVHFLDQLDETPRLSVRVVREEVEDKALRWLRRHDERPYSFVDATSFALMRALRITDALAFDGDFAAAGFVELQA
ncbi:MAG: PIN domain-containing protein [Actinobacteria bacterium]|nr:MAG: PIN domain-containing protein [Actinomycetota bacterium]